MRQETLAPWAEPVPDAPYPMTVGDLLEYPDDSRWQYELVEGRLVRMPASGYNASKIALRLAAMLLNYVDSHGKGGVTGPDGTYNLTRQGETKETGLVPDIAFVQADREPTRSSPDYDKAFYGAPDLAVEIVSPSQYRPEMAAKARRYLDAGARLVWIVWPKYQQVDVWRQGSSEPVATLNIGGTLDGLDVVPGFTFPLAQLFI